MIGQTISHYKILAEIGRSGMAKLAGQNLTKTGAAHGTVAYPDVSGPEQAQARPTDHRTDIWALGVILYEMLTGEQSRSFGEI
jgi:serine/threonine protein kinase